LAKAASPIVNTVIELIFLLVIGGAAILIPLMAFDLYPLPHGSTRFFAAGAIVGGLISIFTTRVVRRSAK